MKQLHKTNAIVIWIVAALLIAFITVSRGLSDTTIKCDAGMLIGVFFMTVLYLSKANDVVKGSGMTVIIALACLGTSIIVGGDGVIFTISFMLLGMALLYFNRKIIITYLAIYLPACLVAGIIDPAYIAGPGGSTTLCMENIFTYGVVGFLMVLATGRGEKLVEGSKTMLKEISSNAEKTENVIQSLNTSIDGNFRNMNNLMIQTRNITDVTYEIETLAKEMDDSASALNTLVSDTVDAIRQNAAMNIELEKSSKRSKPRYPMAAKAPSGSGILSTS